MTPALDIQNTTVVDITYRCNATCRYCQWGNRKNPRAMHRELEEILLPVQTIRALGTQRIVLSGGEPRIHPQLERILGYYRGLVESVIVITNGYGLERAELDRLLENGATGVTVSLDTLNPKIAAATRNTPRGLHEQIVSNLEQLSLYDRKFELGINSVVSHPTANVENVKEVLDFGGRIGVDFVKFQPIFDDGYVSINATDLLLTKRDVPEFLEIAEMIPEIDCPPTNPASFWSDIAALVDGSVLDPTFCGLGNRHAIATAGKLNVCYWVDSASFGDPRKELTARYAKAVRDKFEVTKLRCQVQAHCFCTQNLSHQWKTLEIPQ